MAAWKLCTFGPPRIERDGHPIDLNLRKALALLIYVAVTAQPQSKDTLATLLWPDSSQREARGRLRRTLHRLRDELGEHVLAVSADTIAVSPDAGLRVDGAEFERRADRGLHPPSGGDSSATIEQLTAAAAVYTDDFLAGWTVVDSPVFDEWLFFERERLRQIFAQVLDRLVQSYGAQRAWDAAIPYARRLVGLDPLHEAAQRALMTLYAAAGQYAAAVRQYQECARILDAELGAAPEEATAALYERIRTKQLGPLTAAPAPARAGEQAATLTVTPAAVAPPPWPEGAALPDQPDPAAPPSPPPLPRTAPDLPPQTTPFIGRVRELDDLRALLADGTADRLVTITGPGGIGKSRLALAAAERLQATFADGVCFVPLAPLGAAEDITLTLADRLGLHLLGTDAPWQQILAYLRRKHLLLVLDNVEHLLEGAGLVADLLAAAPRLVILATSRERLRLSGETVHSLAGMALPTADAGEPALVSDATRLFMETARRICPDLVARGYTLQTVTRICRMVQGMPLAIVLAAAWVDVLSPDELVGEIARSLDILEGTLRDLPERQRSVRAVFDASWQRLSPVEQRVFVRLSMFPGGATGTAARAVAGADVHTLRALVDTSFVTAGRDGRMTVHELLRQYAAEKFGDDRLAGEQARLVYDGYYVAFLAEQEAAMKGPGQRAAFQAVADELENIRAAWDSLLRQRRLGAVVDYLLPPLLRYYEARAMLHMGLALIQQAREALLADDAAPAHAAAALLAAQGAFLVSNNYPLRVALYSNVTLVDEQAIREAWSLTRAPEILDAMGFWAIVHAYCYGRVVDHDEGTKRLRQLRTAFRQRGNRWEEAWSAQQLAALLILGQRHAADHAEADEALAQALDVFRELGDGRETGCTLIWLGQLRRNQRAFAEAIDAWQRAQAHLEAAGDWAIATDINTYLGDAQLEIGDFTAAFEYFGRMSRAHLDRGQKNLAAGMLSKESYEALRYSSLDHALRTRQASQALAREAGDTYVEAWGLWELGEIHRVSGEYAAARALYTEARTLFEQVSDESRLALFQAFFHRGLADIADARHEYAAARHEYQRSLSLFRQTGHDWGMAYVLAGVGRTALALGEPDSARACLQDGLARAQQSGETGILIVVLVALAALYAATGAPERAMELAFLVEAHHSAWRETKAYAAEVLEAATALLPPDRRAVAEAAGRASEPWATAAAVAQELAGDRHPDDA